MNLKAHFFSVSIAEEVGVVPAVVFQNIWYWCDHNRSNGTNFFDGRYWTFNSKRALKEQFPYLTIDQVSRALSKLIDAGWLVTGNYNRMPMDRTLWYALTDRAQAIVDTGFIPDESSDYQESTEQNDSIDNGKTHNAASENPSPIPYRKSDRKPDRKKDMKKKPYGSYGNVWFSDEELETLKAEFPADWQERIERVSEYCASTGRTYKNYLATIRVWSRKETSVPKKKTATIDRIDRSTAYGADGGWSEYLDPDVPLF